VNDAVSEIGDTEPDVAQQEVSSAATEPLGAHADAVNVDEVSWRSGNTEKESLKLKDAEDKEKEDVAPANDVEVLSSQMSSEPAEAKDDVSKQGSEL